MEVVNKETLWGLFHRLWTRSVDKEGYDKEEWKELEKYLLVLLQKADALDDTLYCDLMDSFSGRTHHRLLAVAKDPSTEVYVADEKGHLVVKGIGKVDEMLATGYYDVHFGIKGQLHNVRLSCFREIKEG